MKNIHLILILIAALWSVLPVSSPFRSLTGQTLADPGSGGIVTTSDPETDPIIINTPPPRQ